MFDIKTFNQKSPTSQVHDLLKIYSISNQIILPSHQLTLPGGGELKMRVSHISKALRAQDMGIFSLTPGQQRGVA